MLFQLVYCRQLHGSFDYKCRSNVYMHRTIYASFISGLTHQLWLSISDSSPSLSLSQVCRLFNQVIIAMASHGYLSLEGGQLMVEFIVRQCSFNPDDKALAKLASEEVSPVALRDMSSKSLQLITTTIENMDQVCVCVCVCGRGCVYGWPSVCV